ncbi:MAG: AsmA family protein [Candidatus Gorgyraea atricola]|nr:AsmA family protein [Candidatus Gorgyraea atricola]
MKIFFIIVVLLFIVVVVGALVYLLTFDPNEYKGILVEKIEEMIDKDVRIDDVSLSFFPGLALMVDEISVKDREKTWSNAMMEAVSIEARIRILPLIKRKLQIDRLFIKVLDVQFGNRFPLKDSFKDVELRAKISEENLIINRLTGSIAGGAFFIKGIVRNLSSSQDSDMEIMLQGMDVSMFLPDVGPGAPRFEGMLEIDADLSARGLDVRKLLDTLSARASIKLDKAALKNMNLLVVAFERLENILPGLVYKLKNKLPEHYSGLLKDNHTSFRPIKGYLDMKDGKVFLKKTTIESDVFYLVASGYLDLRGRLDMDSELFIPKDLSEACVDAVYELSYLQNSQGLITMPVHVGGSLGDMSIKPDIDYVIEKLAVSTGQELLKAIFRKEDPQQETEAGSEGSEQRQQEVEPAQAIIKTIFDILSAPNE